MKPIDVLTAPWAIVPEKLEEIRQIYFTHLRGEKIDVKSIEASMGRPLQRTEQGYAVQDGVALIPIDGAIAKRMNLFTQISGGASSELIGRDIREAADDPMVRAIVLVIDSPGGTVDGTQTLANLVRSANERKPVVAFADGMMASAAYWIGSAADAIYMSESTAQIGSIGVVLSHMDTSKLEESRGVKVTEIFAGKYKRIATEHAPLSVEGRDYLQERVDQLYTTFVNEVAQFRGTTPERVLADMADGRIFIGQNAIAAGLVDGVSTLDALVAQLSAGKYPRRRKAAGAAAEGDVDSGAGAAPAENPIHPEQEIDMSITKDQVAKDHPAIAEAFRAEGAESERARIKDVEAQAMPGHEQLIEGFKFDGKTTGDQAAKAVLQAEKSKNAGALAKLKAEAPNPAPAAPTTDGSQPPAADLSGLPLEERCKRQWEASAELQSEFSSLAAYTAFERATGAGHARIRKAA